MMQMIRIQPPASAAAVPLDNDEAGNEDIPESNLGFPPELN